MYVYYFWSLLGVLTAMVIFGGGMALGVSGKDGSRAETKGEAFRVGANKGFPIGIFVGTLVSLLLGLIIGSGFVS